MFTIICFSGSNEIPKKTMFTVIMSTVMGEEMGTNGPSKQEWLLNISWKATEKGPTGSE